jgi:NitT/TauT family transport system substrate-binding protein
VRLLDRRSLLFFCAVVSAFTISHQSYGADKTRIAVTNFNLSYLPVGVAIKRGFFKDEGLDVEVIRMNTPNTLTAMITGDVGYTLLFGSVVRAALRGLPIRAVASLLDSPTYALIARPEYKTLKELRGKTVGIANFGGTDEVLSKLIFKAQGIDVERELKFIALGTDRARLAALKEGLVDVAIISPPGDTLGRQMGFNVLTRAYENFNFPFLGIGTNLKSLKEKPQEVRRVTKSLIRANRLIREDKEGAVRVLVDWAKIEREHAVASYDSAWKVFSPDGTIQPDGLRLVLEQAKTELKLTRDVPLSEIVDSAPLLEAQRELGIRRP